MKCLFVGVEPAVGEGHLPEVFDHFDFLFLAEVLVDQRGELEVVGRPVGLPRWRI
jgi:hypothetical protein